MDDERILAMVWEEVQATLRPTRHGRWEVLSNDEWIRRPGYSWPIAKIKNAIDTLTLTGRLDLTDPDTMETVTRLKRHSYTYQTLGLLRYVILRDSMNLEAPEGS